MTPLDDNLNFDRLADGELSLAERQELLSSLDRMNSAAGWRRCALALLEAQVLRHELKAYVTQEAPSMAVEAAEPRMLLSRQPVRVRRWESSLALAASALIAFGVGWAAKPSGDSSPALTAPLEQMAANDAPGKLPHENNRDAIDARDAVTLVVNDDQGKQQRVRLPLVDAGELGNQWAQLAPDVPVDLKTGLRDYGFDVQSKQRFAPLFFEQGQQLVPMVVPVSDTYIVPVNRPVY